MFFYGAFLWGPWGVVAMRLPWCTAGGKCTSAYICCVRVGVLGSLCLGCVGLRPPAVTSIGYVLCARIFPPGRDTEGLGFLKHPGNL